MPGTERKTADLQELLQITKRRLHGLEARAAYMGINADPALTMEIADLQAKVQDLELKLRPPGQLSEEIWSAMSADDQRRYLIALVMTLEADFKDCRIWLSQRVEWAIVVVIALELINLALRWWPYT
jgi:hypothetical protein